MRTVSLANSLTTAPPHAMTSQPRGSPRTAVPAARTRPRLVSDIEYSMATSGRRGSYFKTAQFTVKSVMAACPRIRPAPPCPPGSTEFPYHDLSGPPWSAGQRAGGRDSGLAGGRDSGLAGGLGDLGVFQGRCGVTARSARSPEVTQGSPLRSPSPLYPAGWPPHHSPVISGCGVLRL